MTLNQMGIRSMGLDGANHWAKAHLQANKKPRILAGLVVYESSHILYEAHLKLSILNHNFDGVAVNILNLFNHHKICRVCRFKRT